MTVNVVDLANMGIGVIAGERNKVDRQIELLEEKLKLLRKKRDGFDEEIRQAKVAISQLQDRPKVAIDWEPIDAELRAGSKARACLVASNQLRIAVADCIPMIEGRRERLGLSNVPLNVPALAAN